MESQESQTTHFARHYRQLELDDSADWNLARANYRRLVQLWHPDRFAQRPQERAHAQQEFIKLTKSHTELRNFYRKNKRLPFQVARGATTQDYTSSPDDADDRLLDGAADMDASILKREPRKHGRPTLRSSAFKKATWIVSGAAIMLGTVTFFLILDRKANQAIAEKGREVVKEAPQSEFLPSAAEIRRSQTRGAFVKPTQ